jgi:antitoxin (DNA-binding transcriptional repressor) of toxin-antitoxin stability system
MNTITLKELHQHTGRYARAARDEAFLITDRGHPVAVLSAPVTADLEKTLPRRFSLETVFTPKQPTDSTAVVGAGRDGR